MIRRLIALSLCLSLQQFAHGAPEIFAQTKHVATVSELNKALQQANQSGGDADIVLADGHYQINQRLRFTGSHIRLRSVSGNPSSVVLRGHGMKKRESGTEVLVDISGSNITISGITLERTANHLIQVRAEDNADNFSLSDCVLRDSYEQLLKVSSSSEQNAPFSDDGLIENCLFEYSAGIGPQFYIGGIDAHRAKNWQVNSNTFKNIASPGSHVAEHAIHFWRKSENITVKNNTIQNCDRGIGFGLGEDIANQTLGGLIEKNVISRANLNHKFGDVGIALEASPDIQVINNIIFFETSYPNAIEYRFAATNNVIIRDNITNRAITSRDGGQAVLIANEKASLFEELQSKIKYLIEHF
ncbi:right-handed parallel beta-helix repeat-containing protein [Paraglaciecola sp.]|uniref:right-handed parallel beta-helix repeat-containing protein n=1 Tax=Paraglaciecola sp. TaxID=1920173 RepID=UPI00273F91B6|nr:right-handed parallel beta-helix repeat-containing protein [Paraglaciecola sp.]MDP5030557.1 right-handed parallel beta-helix repeat-containing protein [Paraglaciecola sp.]